MTFETREGWLNEACSKLPEHLIKVGFSFPAALPSDLRVSCGFPSTRALSAKKRRIGECWHGGEPNTQIYISPLLENPLDVLSTLVHELLHATLPKGTQHKAPFKRAMKELGLEGKPIETIPGETLTCCLNDLSKELGLYPHKAITANELLKKKQTTRLRLYECGCEPEEAKEQGRTNKIRAASDSMLLRCEVCGVRFEIR